ncbi:MAG TPA: gliding motility-associated C-terminal domain-containing protein [Bacteroidia bacterium]|nr:gliding motility-associated C-terminal domain-containing protein [Bacteroidia bacterium]
MKKILLIFLAAFLSSMPVFATHNRAGEITFRHLSGLNYEVTIVTYTKESAPADRPYLGILWGDGTSDSLQRNNGNGVIIAPDIKKNIYIGTHVYPGTSTYLVNFEDPNRIGGIVNIPGSVNVPFYIESKLIISAALGFNNSVVLLQPPIDDGVIGHPFIHNPNAYDPDGDSLSYELIVCKGAAGLSIPGYQHLVQYAIGNGTCSIDPVTGDLVWDSPGTQGIFNVAFLVKEWRNGYQIGYVERDMQITIVPSSNLPPVITSLPDLCVEAGTLISFNVIANDPDSDALTLTATGAPFSFNPDAAQFTTATGVITVSSTFTWQTACAHIRKQPYLVTFKAIDNDTGPFPQVNFADLETVQITVVAPSPKNPAAVPLGSSIQLHWDKEVCDVLADTARGYYIYRRNGYYGFFPSQCETGVPAYTGYTKIGSVIGINNTSFTDNNNGAGLVPGVDYCYMIVAYYKDGAQSYASVEVCTHLKKDIPVITNVSVETTDASNGQIYVAWSKPTELDTGQFPGPYQYKLLRSTGFNGDNLSFVTSFNDLNDTTYFDNGLNTLSNPYSYVIELHNSANGLIGKTQVASSIFLSISPTDHKLNLSWQMNVPWNNEKYVIYRENTSTGLWDSIGFSTTKSFSDSGLVNGTQYCYYVMSDGSYSSPGFVDPIINYSQRTCSTPYDNVPPCMTDLDTVNFDCGSAQINFAWVKPPNSCASDIDHYTIYYSPSDGAPYDKLATINDPGITNYTFGSNESIAGCFYITATDTNNNESTHTNEICVDNCPYYELPNVFTPDGNGKNDELHSFPWRFIKDIDLHVFNRWGQEVFSSTDRDFKWNGNEIKTGKPCPSGVYYYLCTVNEIYRSGIKPRALKPGFVQLIRSANSINK